MRLNVLILGALAGFCLAAGARAAKNRSNPVRPVKPVAQATVFCEGQFQVPLTEDAGRALPLHLIGGVSCGERVTLLSKAHGPSVKIRTASGKIGFIERKFLSGPVPAAATQAIVQPPMLLAPLAAPASLLLPAHQPAPADASTDSGIARWQAGAPGCQQLLTNGALVESLTAQGITVQVSLQEAGRALRASVAIANNASGSVRFNPAAFTLDELTPRLRSLAHENPRGSAKAANNQLYLVSATAVAPTENANGQPRYETAALVEATPNYLTQESSQAQASPLTAKTLAPGEKASGVVWFARDKNPQQLTLRIFVDDEIFEFPLSFPAHN